MRKFSLTHKIASAAAASLVLSSVVFFLNRTQANPALPSNGTVANHNVVLDSSSGGAWAPLKAVTLPAMDPTNIAARDATRISDMAQMQAALQLYYKKCGYYPGLPQPGNTCGAYAAIFKWTDLIAALKGSNLGIGNISDDPIPGRHYFYGAKAGAKGYVIGAWLEDPTNPSLAQSAGGYVNGVRCTNPVYCLKL